MVEGDDGFVEACLRLDREAARAIQVAGLLLAHGADPAIRGKDGRTAAEHARGRGLDEVSGLLRVG